MNWHDFIATPAYQQANDAEREQQRQQYWQQHIAPHVPDEHYVDAYLQFNQRTRPRGNPDSGVLGDMGDAFLHGAYQGSADLVSGVDRVFGGNGQNAPANWLRKKAEQQIDDMSPSAGQALQGFNIGTQPDGRFGFSDQSTWAGAGLGIVSGLGSLIPSMIPGGAVGRGLSLGGKALAGVGNKALTAGAGRAASVGTLAEARGVQGLANTIDKIGNHTGYGLTGGAMIGGSAAEGAKNTILNLGYEDLKDNPRFQELYQQTYEQAGGGDTREPFEQAKALLAEEAAQAAFLPGAGVGALSMGIGGPALENVILKTAGTRGTNALKGLLTEGTQEFGEGYGQQMAENYGQQQAGQTVGLTDNALGQALTGMVIGGPVGGLVGGLGRVRNPEQVSATQEKLNDLMSQHQTLQDQMQEPNADQTMLAEQLRQNSIAIANLESWLQHHGEQVPQAEAEAQAAPEGWADHHQSYTDPLTGQYHPPDPKVDMPTGWDDHNPNDPPGGGGVSDNPNAGPQDFSHYDQPAYGRRQARQSQPQQEQQPPLLGTENAIYVEPNSPAQRGETTFTGPGFEQQTNAPYRPESQPAPQPAQQPPQQLGYSPTDFTGNRHGNVSANPDQAQQDSQQRRADQIDKAPSQHPGSPEYTGDPDQDLTRYTERMNSLNRLFRSFNWRKGDTGKKRRVRRLIENQRNLEMKARKGGRGFTPTSMQEALANLKAMVESGEGIRFEREVQAIEARQRQEGMRLTPQQKSGTPSGKKPVLGKADETVMADEREVSTQYALYEQSDLITSHNDTGRVNPDYPAELQPRDRARQASETQIRGIASKLNPKKLGANPLASSGAPIIGSDRVVESGNGRVSAIRKAYRLYGDRAEAYRQYLKDNAEAFGLKPEAIDGFKEPVLVRQRQGKLDTEDRVSFTKEANKPETATMSPAEKAKLDASRITQEDLNHFDTDGTGDLLHRSNDTFLARFADRLGDESAELKTREGHWNKQMRDRVESALFMKAYDDERLNSLFAEDDKPELKNLIKSLAMAAPHFARAKGIDPELGGYGVIDSLVEASRILQDSRNRGQSVDEILDQRSLLDSFSPETELFARWLDANLNKSKQVGQALSELASQIEQYLQKQGQAGGDMFGSEEATLNNLIEQTNQQLERDYGDKSTPIKDPKQAKQTGPVQDAEGSNGKGEPGEPAGRATESAREAQRDEVDDLLDAVDDGTLDSDEWTDDDFAGIEEGKGKYNSRNAPHYSVPGIKSLSGAERAAVKRYLDGREDKAGIVARLKKLADTPWARKTVQSILIRQTIDDLVGCLETWAKSDLRYGHLLTPEQKKQMQSSKGQDTEGTIRLRQIDEPGGRYQAGENEQQSGVEERKRRGKKSNLEDAGQKDLFASPDLTGEERKQQIIENQRVLVKHVETGTIRAGTDTIHTHDDLAHFIAPIRKLAQEEMYAIVLDGNDKVINIIKHSKGQKASASVSPWTLAGAVVATPDAKSVWFAHNHPSGDPEPSTSDVHITHSLNEVLDGSGVINMGHAVVGITGHARIMDADGTVQTGTVAPKRMARNKAFPITERRLRFNRPHINFSSPETVRPFLDTISGNAVVLLDSKYNVTGVLPLSDSDLKTLRHPTDNPAAARIMTSLDSTNSSSVILKSSGSPLAMKGTRNLINFFNRGDRINVLDHFTGKEGDYQSAAEQGFPDLNEGGSFYALRKDTNAKGIQSGPLRLKLKPMEQKLGQAIHVLQSETELPSHLYQTVISDKAQGRVRGLFDPDSGDTYLIAANLDNVGEATRTVLHELVGHKGVRGLLGKRLDTVLDEIHRDMSDRLKQALAKRYARQMEGKSEVEANRIVAEEYLAHLAEKDPKNGLLTKVVSMIRNALRRLFPNIKWTDADAVELLSAARGHLKRNGSFNPNGPKGNRYNDAGRAPTFYSAVERSAAAVKSDKLPAQSWLNAIKKGDFVQDEEIRWLGLDLWLDSKQGEKLSKSDVLSFIRENEVSIAEDLATSNTAANEEELEERLDDMRRRFINERIGDYEHGYHLDEIENALNTAREVLWDSEYEYNTN
ncbi:JAB domain-containing protein [Endozoicomonas sp. ALB091]|uniref:JAB domain-containing protein n=1 Tax=Endozoicomonas sp. ALB091 TaxID=3403073 RepID=UPI003BB76CD5